VTVFLVEASNFLLMSQPTAACTELFDTPTVLKGHGFSRAEESHFSLRV
jgi:hypothetical protein